MRAKQKRTFSNCIIVYCIVYMSVYLWRCLDIITTTDVNATTCVTVAGGFFGGELLAVCLAYVFGKKAEKKTTATTDNIAGDPDITI